jgi:putative transposase
MAEHGVTCSLSRSGNVWDNAAMESFFSSLKIERVPARSTARGIRPEPTCSTTSRGSITRDGDTRPSAISPMQFEQKTRLA